MGDFAKVFLNADSGNRGCSESEVAQLFAQHGWRCECTRLNDGHDVRALAKSEDSGVVYVAAGGDGTVNAVANAIAGSMRAMGVLPLGTLNHFARDLGVPANLADAVAIIVAGQTRRVDAAEVNGLVFVNNSSVGAYPMMVLDRERMKKSGRDKWAALVLASWKTFVRFRRLHVELVMEGRVVRSKTPFVFVGNNAYCLDGPRLGARERLDEGELSVYLAPGARRWTILRMVFAAFFGRMREVPEYVEYKVKQLTVTVRSGRGTRVSLDGEVTKLRGPLRYAVRPASLSVLAPPMAEGRR